MWSRPADIVFGVCALLGAAVLVWAGSGLTFFYDEWLLVLDPDPLSLSTLISPHNGQVFLLPHLIYGAGLEIFGMSSQLPFRLVNVAGSITTLVLLYIYAQRRVDPWLAFVLVLPGITLGAAWEALLLGLSMNFQIGMAAGMGMLLALDQKSRRGDLLASVLLVCSLACGGIGLPFVVGAIVNVIWRGAPKLLWVPLAPLLLFLVFFLAQGGGQDGIDYIGNILNLPEYVWSALRAAIEADTGLSRWSVISWSSRWLSALFALALVAATAWRIRSRGLSASRSVIVVGSILLAFWIFGGLAMSEGRAPEASRYQFAAVVLLIGLVASLFEGFRTPKWLPMAVLPFALLALGSNLVQLKDGRDFLLGESEVTSAAIRQVEIEGSGPGYLLTEEVTGSEYQRLIESNAYLRAARRFGSPAARFEEIQANEAGQRAAAGVEMAAAIARGLARD